MRRTLRRVKKVKKENVRSVAGSANRKSYSYPHSVRDGA